MREKAPRRELKPVEDPDSANQSELVLRHVEDPNRADRFELILTDGDDDFMKYPATREELKKILVKFLHRLERP